MNLCDRELPQFADANEEYETLQSMIWDGVKIFFKGHLKVEYDETILFHKQLVMAFLCDHDGLILRGFKQGGRLSCHMPLIPLLKQKRPEWVHVKAWENDRSNAKAIYQSALGAVIDGLNVKERTFIQLLNYLRIQKLEDETYAEKIHTMEALEPNCLHRVEVWDIEPFAA